MIYSNKLHEYYPHYMIYVIVRERKKVMKSFSNVQQLFMVFLIVVPLAPYLVNTCDPAVEACIWLTRAISC